MEIAQNDGKRRSDRFPTAGIQKQTKSEIWQRSSSTKLTTKKK